MMLSNLYRAFPEKNIPDDMPEYQLKSGESLLDILNNSGLIKSNSEGRRLISQNGVRLDGEAISDPKVEVSSEGFCRSVKGISCVW